METGRPRPAAPGRAGSAGPAFDALPASSMRIIQCKEAVDQFRHGLWVLRHKRVARARKLREPGARNCIHEL